MGLQQARGKECACREPTCDDLERGPRRHATDRGPRSVFDRTSKEYFEEQPNLRSSRARSLVDKSSCSWLVVSALANWNTA